jgi:hypothetical protein
MTTTSLARIGRQISLPIHLHRGSIVIADPRIRSAVVTVLARLLLEAAAASGPREEVRDEP